MVECQELEKWIEAGGRRTMLLNSVTLSVTTGEFVAITGPSGSGKTTLLHLLGLLDHPSRGSLRILGNECARWPDEKCAAFRARSIGLVFQLFHLVPHLTVFENAALPALYARRAVSAPEIWSVLERVALADHAEDYPATLSGGEKQRAAIARALINRPALFLADEPTGSLDRANGDQVIACLQELHHAGTTLILATHDATLAQHAQRQLHMTDGLLEAA